MKLKNIKLPSNKKFGYFFSAIFLIASIYFHFTNNLSTSITLGFFFLIFFFTTLIKADLMLPLNKLWMKIGLIMGMIVSPIVLGVIFYGIFTTISLFFRLIGRDELNLKMKKKKSYWKKRELSNITSESFKQQF
tara:strand:- start:2689 stop:3090 length:402 start_codon:yes stop_codon:yes gene_type:complete